MYKGNNKEQNYNFLLSRVSHFEKIIFSTYGFYFGAIYFIFKDGLDHPIRFIVGAVLLVFISILHAHVNLIGLSYAITAAEFEKNLSLIVINGVWSRFKETFRNTYIIISFSPFIITSIVIFIAGFSRFAYALISLLLAAIFTFIGYTYYMKPVINNLDKLEALQKNDKNFAG